jgi:DNA mismatch repair ATPase MutS
MSVALQLYQQLRDAPDDDSRAKIIASGFEQLEERYPQLKDVATQGHLRETELRLLKEIKEVEAKVKEVEARIKETELRLQKEIRESELRLLKEIKEIDARVKESELRLLKEIKEIEGKVKDTEGKIKDTEIRLMQAIHRQTLWVVGSIGTLFTVIRLLDWFLARMP